MVQRLRIIFLPAIFLPIWLCRITYAEVLISNLLANSETTLGSYGIAMKFRIWHLLYITFLVAILFAMINWLGGWTVLAIAIFALFLGAFGLPMVIFVLAIAFSSEVHKQLDLRSNKAVVVCFSLWLVCVTILLVFLSIASLVRFF